MALIDEKELKKHIKNRSFSAVYLLYGAEKMFVSRYTELLAEAVAGKNPSDFNFHTFEGNVDVNELAAAIQVVPFMSEYNCVVLKDIEPEEMRDDEVKKLLEAIEFSGNGTVLIISMPTFVPTKEKGGFYSIVRLVTKLGSVCEFKKMEAMAIERYVAKWANQNGKMISQINASKLISYCGTDLTLLKNEVNKICAYAKSEEITLEDIEKLATVNNVEVKVFAMTDAVINRKPQVAFNALNNLILQGAEPIPTFAALATTFIDAYRIRVADESGVVQNRFTEDFVAYKRKLFVISKVRNATRHISTEALRKCVDTLMEADTTLKTNMKDSKTTFQPFMETLIARLLLIAEEGRV